MHFAATSHHWMKRFDNTIASPVIGQTTWTISLVRYCGAHAYSLYSDVAECVELSTESVARPTAPGIHLAERSLTYALEAIRVAELSFETPRCVGKVAEPCIRRKPQNKAFEKTTV